MSDDDLPEARPIVGMWKPRAGERACESRGCGELATWGLHYKADSAGASGGSWWIFLCQRHGRARRNTKRTYIVERGPLAR